MGVFWAKPEDAPQEGHPGGRPDCGLDKKQIGRMHDPQPFGIKSEGGAHVEPFEKGLICFKKPVPILVLMNGDAVLSPEFLVLRQKEWRWGGTASKTLRR